MFPGPSDGLPVARGMRVAVSINKVFVRGTLPRKHGAACYIKPMTPATIGVDIEVPL